VVLSVPQHLLLLLLLLLHRQVDCWQILACKACDLGC
jgi:hypothetical protein